MRFHGLRGPHVGGGAGRPLVRLRHTPFRFRCIPMSPSRRQWRWLALVITWAASQPVAAWRHPVPLATATITLEADGRYRLEIACDVAAYIMQAEPGHLAGQLAEEFRALPPDDLQAMAADARQALARGLQLDFDRPPARPATVALPDPAALQAAFQAGRPRPAAVIRAVGTVPRGASRLTVRFPADVGPGALQIIRAGRDGEEACSSFSPPARLSEPIPLNPAS